MAVLGNENKKNLQFARFCVTLASPKLLRLGKTQMYLVLRSFLRNFAACF